MSVLLPEGVLVVELSDGTVIVAEEQNKAKEYPLVAVR